MTTLAARRPGAWSQFAIPLIVAITVFCIAFVALRFATAPQAPGVPLVPCRQCNGCSCPRLAGATLCGCPR